MLFFCISCPNVMLNRQRLAVMQSLLSFHPLGPQQVQSIQLIVEA